VPLAGNAPLQFPVAVHPVALVELHVSVDAPPLATAVGSAVNVAFGTILTVTAAAVLVPPAPVQVSENVVFVVSAPVLWVPLDATVPLQPPEAVQELASVELHVNVDSSPLLIVSLAALIDTVGRGDESPPPPPPPQAASNCAATIATNGLNARMISPLSFF